MWKTIILCASLFGGGAVGLAAGARWIDPAALPAAAAIGLCLIGIVLILAAPTESEEALSAALAREPPLRGALAHSQPVLSAVDISTPPMASAAGGEDSPAGY